MPKRSKGIKKTDIDANKPWLKKVGVTILGEPHISSNKTYLIVCEGQTEELYFKSFKKDNVTVKAYGLGCTKLKLIECTLGLMEHELYDEVWSVFDMDYSPRNGKNQFYNFDNAISKGIAEGIKVAYSNDAFELWFLLHYMNLTRPEDRKFIYKKLSEYWNINYEKEGKKRKFARGISEILESDERASLDKAIEYSKNLFHSYPVEEPYHKRNPITAVHLLIKELEYM